MGSDRYLQSGFRAIYRRMVRVSEQVRAGVRLPLPGERSGKRESGLGRRGFTLLETLIAMSVMAIAFTAILSTQSSSISASIRAHEMTIVAMLAKDEMVQTEYAIRGKSFDEVKEETGDNFKAPYENYRWTRKIKEVEFPNLALPQNGGNGSGSSNSDASAAGDQESSSNMDLVTKLIAQFLSKAVREVTVTIYWKKSGKEMSYSVTTYWVDLNHEFQLSQ